MIIAIAIAVLIIIAILYVRYEAGIAPTEGDDIDSDYFP